MAPSATPDIEAERCCSASSDVEGEISPFFPSGPSSNLRVGDNEEPSLEGPPPALTFSKLQRTPAWTQREQEGLSKSQRRLKWRQRSHVLTSRMCGMAGNGTGRRRANTPCAWSSVIERLFGGGLGLRYGGSTVVRARAADASDIKVYRCHDIDKLIGVDDAWRKSDVGRAAGGGLVAFEARVYLSKRPWVTLFNGVQVGRNGVEGRVSLSHENSRRRFGLCDVVIQQEAKVVFTRGRGQEDKSRAADGSSELLLPVDSVAVGDGDGRRRSSSGVDGGLGSRTWSSRMPLALAASSTNSATPDSTCLQRIFVTNRISACIPPKRLSVAAGGFPKLGKIDREV